MAAPPRGPLLGSGAVPPRAGRPPQMAPSAGPDFCAGPLLRGGGSPTAAAAAAGSLRDLGRGFCAEGGACACGSAVVLEDLVRKLDLQREAVKRSLEDYVARLDRMHRDVATSAAVAAARGDRLGADAPRAGAPWAGAPWRGASAVPAAAAAAGGLSLPGQTGIDTVLLDAELLPPSSAQKAVAGDQPAPPQRLSTTAAWAAKPPGEPLDVLQLAQWEEDRENLVTPAGEARRTTHDAQQAQEEDTPSADPKEATHPKLMQEDHHRARKLTFFNIEESKMKQRMRRVQKTVEDLGIHERFAPVEDLQKRVLWKITHSNRFNNVSCAAILLNAAFLGISAQVDLKEVISGETPSEVFKYVEIIFCIWFTFELVVRLLAEQFTFFYGSDWKMNMLDFFLVIVTILGMIFNPKGGASSATVARLMRLIRFIRVLRMFRVAKSFQNLRLLVFSIISSMGMLMWCALVVFAFVYSFAIFFMNGAAEYFRNHPLHERDPQVAEGLDNNFGSLMRSMICLFMSISGGIDWSDAINPLRTVHWLYEPAFIFYTFIMLFGVLNVVVATFVENTAQLSRKDETAMINHEMKQVAERTARIKKFFHEADVDRSGHLSWDEFERHLEDDQVKAYFQTLELDVSEAHVLFELLDQDASDQVDIDEFVGGCMRLKGTARSIDVNMLIRRNAQVLERITMHMEMTNQILERVRTPPPRKFSDV